MPTEMTMRDQFAASALTGLANIEPESASGRSEIALMAYELADALLRCRGGGDCPRPDNAPNHDAAPAARAPEPEPGPAARRRPAGGTGDTQSFDAYRRFAGEVMNWISEATSAYAASCGSDGGRNIMADACSRCWDAFDRIAHPTIHGAAPAARASVDSVVPQPTTHGDSDRTDNAAPRPSEGTGDTPKPINACDSDMSTPINGPDPDSRVWETHTLATHATPGEGSVPREGTQEPVAWGVAGLGGVLATSISRRDAVDMQGDYEFVTDVVPLYRQPPCPVCLAARSGHNFSQQNLTLTETEAETLRELRDEAAQYADEIGLTSSEIRARQRIIDGLLERLGGGR